MKSWLKARGFDSWDNSAFDRLFETLRRQEEELGESLKPAIKKKANLIAKEVEKEADDDYDKLKLAGEVMDQILGEDEGDGKVDCEHCGGAGYHEKDGEKVTCKECDGTGKVDIGRQSATEEDKWSPENIAKMSPEQKKKAKADTLKKLKKTAPWMAKGLKAEEVEVNEDWSDHKKNKY